MFKKILLILTMFTVIGSVSVSSSENDKKIVNKKHDLVNLAAVKVNGKWGYIETDGEFFIEPIYYDAKPFSEGLAPVKTEITAYGYLKLMPFGEHSGKSGEYMGRAHKWGYIDSTGHMVIPPIFSDAEPFADKKAHVQLNFLSDFEVKSELNSFTYVEVPRNSYKIGDFPSTPFNNTMYLYIADGFRVDWIFQDNSGRQIINAEEVDYDFDGTHSNKKGKEWIKYMVNATISDVRGAFINEAGSIISRAPEQISSDFINDLMGTTELGFDEKDPFSEGFSRVKKDEKYGYIDESNKLLIALQYEDAKSFSDGAAAVKIGGRWGFIDKEGKWIIENQYEDAGSFYDGLAPVKTGGKWGFINKEGVMIIDAKFEDALDFSFSGMARVKFEDIF